MLLEKLLRVVGSVKGLAIFVLAGTGVVAADNEVRAAVILANQSVPNRLTRPAQTHGQGQHRELHGAVRIFCKQQFVAACADEIIHVARLGHSDRRMNQQIGFDLLGGAHGEFDVRAVHGITCLERDNVDPAQACEFGSQFSRRQPKGTEIVVRGRLEFLDPPPDIPRVRFIDGVVGARMRGAGGIENGLCFGLAVGLPHIFDMQHAQHHALGVAQRDVA